MKITFQADTNNKTILIGKGIRLRPGANTVDEDMIRDLGIDLLPFVTMPPEWNTPAPSAKTEADAPFIKIDTQKFDMLNGDERNLLGAQMRAEQEKINSKLFTAGHLTAMDNQRALDAIGEITDITTLVDTISRSNRKIIKEAARKRIHELDPDNPFGR